MLKTLLKVNLLGLLNSLFKGNNDKSKKKKSTPLTVALIVIFAIFVVGSIMTSISAVFFTIAQPYSAMNLSWLYFSITSILIFLMTFVGSVFSAQSLLFNSKDNELLLSMPIPPFYILTSRILLLFILNSMYGVLVAIPAIAAYFVATDFSAVTLALFILATVLIIVFSSALTGFLGWVIAIVSSRVRKNNLMQIIASVAFFGIYYVICFNMSEYMQMLVEKGEVIANAIQKAFPPFYYFGLICAEHKLWAVFALAAISIIPFVLVCILISKSFIKITAGKKIASKVKYVEKELKVSGVKSALLRKEISKFFSLPALILNSATGIIMQILLTGMVIFNSESLIDQLGLLGDEDIMGIVPWIICMGMGFLCSMIDPAATLISLEGNRINLIRSMPISSDDFYFAKFAANYIIGLPTTVICTVIICIFLKIPVLTSITMLAVLLLFFALTTLVNLTANICMPKFIWNSETVVIKQSGSVIVGMLAGIALTGVCFSPYFILMNYVSLNIYLLLAAVIITAISLIFIKFIKTSGKKKFEQMNA